MTASPSALSVSQNVFSAMERLLLKRRQGARQRRGSVRVLRNRWVHVSANPALDQQARRRRTSERRTFPGAVHDDGCEARLYNNSASRHASHDAMDSRMLTAISRYGVRVAPGTEAIVEQCKRTGHLVQGPAIEQFERAFEARIGQGTAIAASYGRMAFYHILK